MLKTILNKLGTPSPEEGLVLDVLRSAADIKFGDKRLNNIAALTYNVTTCEKIFKLIEKALDPAESTWRMLNHACLLLRTIVLFGSEGAVDRAIGVSRFAFALQSYNSALAKGRGGSGGTDYGGPVRSEARLLYSIMQSDNTIRTARLDARKEGGGSLVPVGVANSSGNSSGASMSFGEGVEKAIGAGYGLDKVPGMYENRPERYFDCDNDFRRQKVTPIETDPGNEEEDEEGDGGEEADVEDVDTSPGGSLTQAVDLLDLDSYSEPGAIIHQQQQIQQISIPVPPPSQTTQFTARSPEQALPNKSIPPVQLPAVVQSNGGSTFTQQQPRGSLDAMPSHIQLNVPVIAGPQQNQQHQQQQQQHHYQQQHQWLPSTNDSRGSIEAVIPGPPTQGPLGSPIIAGSVPVIPSGAHMYSGVQQPFNPPVGSPVIAPQYYPPPMMMTGGGSPQYSAHHQYTGQPHYSPQQQHQVYPPPQYSIQQQPQHFQTPYGPGIAQIGGPGPQYQYPQQMPPQYYQQPILQQPAHIITPQNMIQQNTQPISQQQIIPQQIIPQQIIPQQHLLVPPPVFTMIPPVSAISTTISPAPGDHGGVQPVESSNSFSDFGEFNSIAVAPVDAPVEFSHASGEDDDGDISVGKELLVDKSIEVIVRPEVVVVKPKPEQDFQSRLMSTIMGDGALKPEVPASRVEVPEPEPVKPLPLSLASSSGASVASVMRSDSSANFDAFSALEQPQQQTRFAPPVLGRLPSTGPMYGEDLPPPPPVPPTMDYYSQPAGGEPYYGEELPPPPPLPVSDYGLDGDLAPPPVPPPPPDYE